MKRREWLYYVGVTGVGGAVGWHFLNLPPSLTLPDLRKTLVEAERFQAPVLVFVIPEDSSEAWRYGVALGAFLNSAADETLARLGICDVVCVPLAAVRSFRERFSQPLPADPMLVLVGPDVDEHGLLRTSVLPASEVLTTGESVPSPDTAPTANPEEARVHGQNARIARFLSERLDAPRIHAIAKLIAKNCDLKLFAKMMLDEKFDQRDRVIRTVLHCQWAAVPVPDIQVQGDTLAQLVNIGRNRYVKLRPEGALWTTDAGCGSATYEGIELREETELFMCGIGFTTALEARFLTFLTDENIDRFR